MRLKTVSISCAEGDIRIFRLQNTNMDTATIFGIGALVGFVLSLIVIYFEDGEKDTGDDNYK